MNNKGEIMIYQTEDFQTQIDLCFVRKKARSKRSKKTFSLILALQEQ